MSVGALSFFGSEGYDVRHTKEGICAQSDLFQYTYIVKHYAGGVNSEFSNFGLFQKQMGIRSINSRIGFTLSVQKPRLVSSVT